MSLKGTESISREVVQLQKEFRNGRMSKATYDRKMAELMGQPDPGTKRTFLDNLLGRK